MKPRLRRLAIYAGGFVATWLAVLLILGFVYGSGYGQGVADRMGEALAAQSTIEDSDLALVRGRLELGSLRARRDDSVGRLELDVGQIRCELLPFGLALVDRDCRVLAIAGVRLDVSSFAMFNFKRPKRKPINAGAVLIEDATLSATTSMGRVSVKLDRIEAGATTFKTPLSWLFALESFRASVDTPFGMIDLAYQAGVLTASGTFLGPRPLTLPITLPVRNVDDEPSAELERIKQFGRDTIDRVLKERMKSVLEPAP